MSQTINHAFQYGPPCVLLGGFGGRHQSKASTAMSRLVPANNGRTDLAVESLPVQVCALLQAPKHDVVRWLLHRICRLVRRWRQ